MQADNNLQNSANLSQGSHGSDQNPTRTVTSSASIEISEELAFIKREVANLKEQVWNRVHNDIEPSEGCSIQNSLTDAPFDFPCSDEAIILNGVTSSDKNDRNSTSMTFSAGYRLSNLQESSIGLKPNESSMNTSSLGRNQLVQLCEITLGNSGSPNASSLFVEKETLYNGNIINPASAWQKKEYIVASIHNEIHQKNRFRKKKNTSVDNPFVSDRRGSEKALNGSKNNNNIVLIPNLDHFGEGIEVQENKSKYIELTAAPRMFHMNESILEGEVETRETVSAHPFLKKTLSVIFSTNESIQSTPTHSVGKKSLTEAAEEISPIKSAYGLSKDTRRGCESIKEECSEEKITGESCPTHGSEGKRSYKELPITESDRNITGGDAASNIGSEENFMGLIYVTKLLNKDNKDLENKLIRLTDLHCKQVDKYEKVIQMLHEKAEKYARGNELLVKTLKTCEKEIDTLALNNQTLHKNILMFEEDLNRRKMKEKQLIEANIAMQKENNMIIESREKIRAYISMQLLIQITNLFKEKVKEELQKKQTELEDIKKKLNATVSRADSAKMYAKSCEDCISAIDQTLRRILTEKGGPKMSLIVVGKVLESISLETSKFVEKLSPNNWVSTGAIEAINKSPIRKDNLRCFTSIGSEESFSFDTRHKTIPARLGQRDMTKTTDRLPRNMSPVPKSKPNGRTFSGSPSHNNDKLIQKLLNTSVTKSKKTLTHNKPSFDSRKHTENGERSNSRSKKDAGYLRSYSTPPVNKTPEKPKINNHEKKKSFEIDKVKDNFRKKIVRSVSPTPQKR